MSVCSAFAEFVKEAQGLAVSFGCSGRGCPLARPVERLLMSLTRWALEDPDVLQVIIASVKDIVFFSAAPTALSSSDRSSFFSGRGTATLTESSYSEETNPDVLQSLLPLLCHQIADFDGDIENPDDSLWDDSLMAILECHELMRRVLVVSIETVRSISSITTAAETVLSREFTETCSMLISLLMMILNAVNKLRLGNILGDQMTYAEENRLWTLLLSEIHRLGDSETKIHGNGAGIAVSDSFVKDFKRLSKRAKRVFSL
jgi:hypothetical protein